MAIDSIISDEPKRMATSGPFGDPDAARASDNDEFIDIEGIIPSPTHDLHAMSRRIIVGRKGSGKSHYLRWHRLAAIKRDLIVFSESAHVSTALVAKIDAIASREAEIVSRETQGRFVDIASYITNFWSQVWERSLFLTAARVMLTSAYIEQGEKSRALEVYSDLFLQEFDQDQTPVTFVTLMHESLSGIGNSPAHWRSYLDSSKWSKLRMDLSKWCRQLPPLAIYIDAVDDDFEDAPQMWLHCQGGLFKTAFESLYRNEHLAGRVHLVVAIRDVAYSGILQSEHRTRYTTHGRIEHLNWDKSTIRSFLHEKIVRINKSSAANPDRNPSNEPFLYWLGFDTVRNIKRNNVERVSDYIIRHTRMLPRDIVIIGNAISERMSRRIKEGKTVSDAPLRQQVSDVAKYLAEEAIRLCVLELTMSAEFISEVILQDWKSITEGKNSIEIMKSVTLTKVTHFFQLIASETFSRDDLEVALSLAGLSSGSTFSQHQFFRFDNILWRHGLLAVSALEGEKARWRFRWRGNFEEATIDRECGTFGFHSSLIDLFHLEIRPDGPVF